MKTLEQVNPTAGSVHTLKSERFGIATLLCVLIPHVHAPTRYQFAPLDENGIERETLHWDSVRTDEVLESFPNIRAYLIAKTGLESPPPTFPPEDNPELVRRATECLRAADELHVKSGGGTRHFIRECWLPLLAEHGLRLKLGFHMPQQPPAPSSKIDDPVEKGRRAVLKTLGVAREGLSIDQATQLLRGLENEIGDAIADLATMEQQNYEEPHLPV